MAHNHWATWQAGWCLALILSGVADESHADDARDAHRAQLLQQMRGLAETTKVRMATADRPADFVINPVFRYDDQARNFIDATMWVWTDDGRPIAFQKIEAVIHPNTRELLWGYCFTSMATQSLSVTWSDAKPYVSTEAGLTLKPLPQVTEPAAMTSISRKRQMREIARSFSVRIIINPKTNSTAEMRLLPTPIYEFNEAESKLPLGAVFGFSSNGTNPDLLVMLEAVNVNGTATWHFSPARMTTGGLKLRFHNDPVWEAEFVDPHAGPFGSWTFFRTPRKDVSP